ncbi:hypothetical protein EB72_19355 [Mycobacterium sp. SWH-M1]|nr:hypothetical protein EB72_19355 [Mycobacterium sp. SWH-M1]
MQISIDLRQLADSPWDWTLYTTADGAKILGVMFTVGPYKIDIERFFALPERRRPDDPGDIAAHIRREYPNTSYVEIPKGDVRKHSRSAGTTNEAPGLNAAARTAFADKVQEIVGPSLSRRGFTFDQVAEVDEGGRAGFAAFFQNTVYKVQVYWSGRARELNCMIAAHDAPYVHGLYDASAQWHYLNDYAARPDIPLEQLVEHVRSDEAHFKNDDAWLAWLATRIDEYYESAVAGIRGEMDLEGRDHERH